GVGAGGRGAGGVRRLAAAALDAGLGDGAVLQVLHVDIGVTAAVGGAEVRGLGVERDEEAVGADRRAGARLVAGRARGVAADERRLAGGEILHVDLLRPAGHGGHEVRGARL